MHTTSKPLNLSEKISRKTATYNSLQQQRRNVQRLLREVTTLDVNEKRRPDPTSQDHELKLMIDKEDLPPSRVVNVTSEVVEQETRAQRAEYVRELYYEDCSTQT